MRLPVIPRCGAAVRSVPVPAQPSEEREAACYPLPVLHHALARNRSGQPAPPKQRGPGPNFTEENLSEISPVPSSRLNGFRRAPQLFRPRQPSVTTTRCPSPRVLRIFKRNQSWLELLPSMFVDCVNRRPSVPQWTALDGAMAKGGQDTGMATAGCHCLPNGFRIPLPCDTAENFGGLNRCTAGCHDARVQLCCFFRLPSTATKCASRSADLRLTVSPAHCAPNRPRSFVSRCVSPSDSLASPRLTSPRIAVPRKLARSLQHAAATAATLCPADPVPHISAIRRLVSRPVSPAAASSRRGGKDSSSSQREKKNLAEQPGTDAVLSTTATAALHSSTAAIWSPATRLLLSALQACRQTVHSGRCGAPSPRRHPRAIYRGTPPSHSLAVTSSPSSRSPFSPFLH